MFGQSIKLFDLLGFPIRIDASWFLIAALIVWSLATGYFPQALPGVAPMGHLALGMVAMLGLFASQALGGLAGKWYSFCVCRTPASPSLVVLAPRPPGILPGPP